MANKWLKVAAVSALSLALVAGFVKAFKARQDKQAQATEAAAALRTPTVFELSEQDVVIARKLTLVKGVPISGSLRAATSALVKAKVAGELNGLQVREGDTVRAGQVLARIDTTEYQARVAQAAQQTKATQAQLDMAQRQLNNNQALVNQGFISQTALENSLASLQASQANHQAALAALDIARKSLADTLVKSPLTGQVAARLVQNGERVGIDARILELVDGSSLEMEAAVPPAQAVLLRTGQSAQITVEGLASPIKATVSRIGPSAQAVSRSVLVYLSFPMQEGLRPGLFAQGQVWVGESAGVAVPASSLHNDKPLPYVQQVLPGASATETATIAHVPVKVLDRGRTRTSLEAATPGMAEQDDAFAIIDSIAESSILTSGKAGFIQERSAVRLPGTSAPASGGASRP